MNDRARRWLERSIGSDAVVARIEELPGSTSSSVFRVDARDRSGSIRCVLRVFSNSEWSSREPDLAEHEAAVLCAAEAAAVPAPRLISHTTQDVGFGAPAVLMTWLDGSIDVTPAARGAYDRLAETLAAIHAAETPALLWRFRSWTDRASVSIPDWSQRPTLWVEAIERWREGPPAFEPVFLHRDFHPTNVLWRAGRVSGVVDWVNGCLGPAGVDVAHCRLNLALMYDAATADAFMSAYAKHAGESPDQCYWDIDVVLGALPDPTYYEPWQHFGLARLSQAELRARLEAHLARIVARL